MPYVALLHGQWVPVESTYPHAQQVSDITYASIMQSPATASISATQSMSDYANALVLRKKVKKSVEADVFIRKNSTNKPGLNIASLMRSKIVTGDIGIEIEVEGNKFPKGNGGIGGSVHPELIPGKWAYHHDGSLRGNDNAEYVLKKPIKFADVPKAVQSLWDMFDSYGSKLDDSNRTSVHIHLNAQNWHLNRLCSFAALYFSLEEILTEWCGDHRVGNLFCLRGKDAPAIISELKSFIENDGEYPLREGLHYGGLNVHALYKFGSLEIRALRGCTDAQTILDWVSILERLYKLSGEYKDPRGICEGFSGEGPIAYLSSILGDKFQTVKDGINWDNQRIMESMYEGIRLAQDLCYCREWSEYNPVDVAPDPFQRDPKKVAESLTDTVYQSLEQQYFQTAASQPAILPPMPASWTTFISEPENTLNGEDPEESDDDDWFVDIEDDIDEI